MAGEKVAVSYRRCHPQVNLALVKIFGHLCLSIAFTPAFSFRILFGSYFSRCQEEVQTSNNSPACTCSWRSAGWSILDELLPLNRLPVTTTSPWNLRARPMPRRIELIRQLSKLALQSGV